MDRYEQNDTAATATNLGAISGTRTESALDMDAKDFDWYRFTLGSAGRSGDRVRITFTHAQGDLDLALVGADGSTVLTVSEGTADSEQIDLAGLAAGTYYAVVYGYDGAASPSYTLAVTAAATSTPGGDRFEDNDSAAAATNLGTIGGPLTQASLSVESNDLDWYRFTLPVAGRSGDEVGITFAHARGDLDIALLAADGTTVIGVSEGTLDGERIGLGGLPAGSYYVVVYGYEGAANPDYALSLSSTPSSVAADRYENNDTAATATALGSISGTVTQGTLTVERDDLDWYRFTLPATGRTGDQVALSFNHAQGDVDLVLLAADGTTLLDASDGTSNGELISLSGVPAGTYYAVVYGYGGATNPSYSISVTAAPTTASADRFEQNDSASSATDLRTISGTLTESSLSVERADPDWYRFTLAAPGRSGDRVALAFNHALGDIDMALYAGNGSTVLARSEGTTNTEEISLAGLAAGTYYVQVFGYSNASNPNYALTVAAAPATSGADRFEQNDSAAAAANLRTISGTLTEANLSVEANDPDWYRFTLAAAGRSGDKAAITFNTALGDLDFALVARDGTTVLAASDGVSNSEEISLAGLAAGDYYVVVYGYDGAANPNYTLSIAAATATTSGADRFEDNDTPQAATDLRTISGALSETKLSVEANDADWYRFTLSSSGRANDAAAIAFNHAAGDLDLALYKSDGTTLIAFSDGTADGESISLAGLAAGSYLVKVYGYAGVANPDYTLSVSAAPGSGLGADAWEANNSAAQATPIRQAQQTLQNATITSGDRDWFTFTLPTAGALADGVTVNARGGDVDVRLLNAQQQVVATSASNASGQASLALANLPAGQYFVDVGGRTATSQAEYDIGFRAGGTTTTSAQGTWTILVYIAGDNDLERFAVADVNEMEAAALRAGLNVGVLFDRSPGFDTSNGNWSDTRRGAIARDTNTSQIGSSLASVGELDMGNPQTLTDFINWGAANLPAQRYALVIWDHGGGALLGSAWDDTNGKNNLTDQEVRQAIAASSLQRVDLLGFDACLMAAVEMASDAAPVASVLVASERIEPGEGWEYTGLLTRFSNATASDPAALAAAIVDSYAASQTPAETLSAIDLTRVAAIETAINAFVGVMRTGSAADWQAVRTAHSRAQIADDNFTQYIDLADFMNQLETASSNAQIDGAARAVAQAVQAAVLRDASPGTFHGLTVVLSNNPSNYQGYNAATQRFLANTTWDDFLALYAQNRAPAEGRALTIDTTGPDWAERYDLGGTTRPFDGNNTSSTSVDLGTINVANYRVPSLTLDPQGDLDWFRFALPAGAGLTPSLTIQAANAAAGVTARLLTSAQTVVAEASTAAGSGALTFNQVSAGTAYFLEVRAAGGGAPVYDLRIDAFGAAAPADPLADFAEANGGNNSRAKAVQLGDAAGIARVGGLRNLTLNAADLQGGENGGDWFRVDSARTVESNANRVSIDGAVGGDVDIRVYDLAGTLLAESATSGSSAETLAFARQVSDVYVQVYSRGSAATANYTLEVWSQLESTLEGSAAADNLVDWTGGAMLLRGLAGNDRIDGRDGIDTAGYTVARAGATLARSGGGWSVTSAADGQDTLANVERLAFADTAVALDLAGNAGVVAKTLGAVFGRAAVANKAYAGIGLYYVDGGMSYAALMQAAIDVRLGAGASHGAVVDLLYANLAGVPAPTAERAAFVAQLDSGSLTVAALGMAAADHALNAANINLVGLEQQGLEFSPFAG